MKEPAQDLLKQLRRRFSQPDEARYIKILQQLRIKAAMWPVLGNYDFHQIKGLSLFSRFIKKLLIVLNGLCG
ncbi:hypothetical protein BRY73_05155 [Ochrobactrum sp. P6BS-III]|nr:hypothetical protein BRY73_05155 [Ochrobactrum sp. P6BS-III]